MPLFKRQTAVLLGLALVALGAAFFFWPEPTDTGSGLTVITAADKKLNVTNNNNNNISAAADNDVVSNSDGNGAVKPPKISPKGKTVVYVVGGVKHPGVYDIKKDECRVEDAVIAAGGFSPLADIEAINLAQKISDGEKILVPRRKVDYQESAANHAVGKADGLGSNNDQIVHINSATQAELETLPGIGPAIASRIIEFRRRNGSFRQVDDLSLVSGIGPAKMARIRNRVAL